MTTIAKALLFISDCIMEAVKEKNIEKERYFRGMKAGIKYAEGEKQEINSNEWNKRK